MLNSQNDSRSNIIMMALMIILYASLIQAKDVHAQSSQSITSSPTNMAGRAIDRTGTAFSGRNSVSIKSTDAGRIPRYQKNNGCINCGTVDFINVIGQGGNIDLITGGIISGMIRNRLIHHGQNQPYPIDPRISGNMHPSHQFSDDSTHYNIGVTMDDGTQSVITHQHAPNFHRGDRIELIDGELVPHSH